MELMNYATVSQHQNYVFIALGFHRGCCGLKTAEQCAAASPAG